MSIQQELGFPNPVHSAAHEAALSIVLTGNLLTKESDRTLRPVGITSAQFNLLMLLKYQSTDGMLNQTRLGRMLLVHRSNVTGLVDRMEDAGWVTRMAEAGDRRVKLIRLTQRGERILARAEKAYFGRLEQAMASLSGPDQERLCQMLDRLRARLRAAGRKGRR